MIATKHSNHRKKKKETPKNDQNNTNDGLRTTSANPVLKSQRILNELGKGIEKKNIKEHKVIISKPSTACNGNSPENVSRRQKSIPSHLGLNNNLNGNNSNSNSITTASPNIELKNKTQNKNYSAGVVISHDKPSISTSENISIFKSKAKSVKQYSYQEERNLEFRGSMEDMHKIIDKFMGENSKGFFSLYDGHGGINPAKYAKERMPEIFTNVMAETNNNVEKSLYFSFQMLDEELKTFPEIDDIGCTATVVYILKETDVILGSTRVVYCANVGDSRCVLLSSAGCKSLSYDHKSTDANEVSRVKKAGGVIINGRVQGHLALTRALGDFAMKKYVPAVPNISKHVVSEKDKYIIMCSDGVWDVVTEEDMFYFGIDCSTAEEFARSVVQLAKERKSQDNISCIVIKL